MQKPSVLIISGFDPFNLAGYGSDIRVATKIGVHPFGIITALTSQIPGRVKSIYSVESDLIKEQLNLLGLNYSIDAVKIGMIYSKEVCEVVAKFLKNFKNAVIIDPVIKATAGKSLIKKSELKYFKEKFLPLGTLITPNIPEAMEISGLKTTDQKKLCEKLFDIYQIPVLVKGGHKKSSNEIIKDCFFTGELFYHWDKKWVNNVNTHGSGCFLSSAIASYCAKGFELIEAIDKAQDIIGKSLNNPVRIEKENFLSHY